MNELTISTTPCSLHLIALLESYLQDRLCEELENSEERVRELIRKYSLDRKFTPEDVIRGPHVIANEIIEGTVFHKLPVVNSLYKIVYGVDILSLMKEKEIFSLIKLRHRIVHHSSRVQGKKIVIREMGILKAMNSISRWVENIEFYLNKKRSEKVFLIISADILSKLTLLRVKFTNRRCRK